MKRIEIVKKWRSKSGIRASSSWLLTLIQQLPHQLELSIMSTGYKILGQGKSTYMFSAKRQWLSAKDFPPVS
jgi:hypothetical protein